MPRFSRGLVLAAALALAGCSLSGQEARDDAAQAEVTKAQLAAMVLPKAELGTVAEGTRPAKDSGAVANAEAADSSVDPHDTAKSLRNEGRLSGQRAYFVGSDLAAVRKRGGLFLAGTEVELLEDPVYAAQYLHKGLGDFQRFQGKQPDGSKLSGVSGFQVTGVGDEAGGLRTTMTLGRQKLHMTAVAFRRDRIVAVAAVLRGDREDASGEARALAVKLDKRIQDVLAGRIETGPAPVTENAEQVEFVGEETLPEHTVAAKDVAPGAGVADEGRLAGDDHLAYYRVFEDVRLGGSHLIKLKTETRLYRTKADAAAAYRALGTAVGRAAYGHELVETIAEETGLTVTAVQIQALQRPGKGYQGVVVTFESRDGSYRFGTVVTRSGALLASVTGFCHTDALDPNDLKPLARRARALLA
jgi:hypothetical protein